MFKAAVTSIRRIMSGTEITRVEIVANQGYTRLSLRLRESRHEAYAVLAVKTPGHTHFTEFSRTEFLQLAAAVDTLRTALSLHETPRSAVPPT